MRVFALLSWYAENPKHLTRCVASLKGFADVVVAVDGAYATFPGGKPWSELEEQVAIRHAARGVGLPCHIRTTARRWDSEVQKRAFMFDYARRVAGATPDDWFLVIDADEALGEVTSDARDLLAESNRDVAEVGYQGVQIDGKVFHTSRERRLYRALPGLTVERAHYLYVVPGHGAECGYCMAVGQVSRRFLWRRPDGHLSDEPIVDLFGCVTMQHFNSGREPERRQRALDYYKARDAAGLEAVGDWR